jgi:peptidoglycan-associated lipoprotein
MNTDRCLRLVVTLMLLTSAGCASETKSSAPPAPSPAASPAEAPARVETPVSSAPPAAAPSAPAPAAPAPGPAPEPTYAENPGLQDVPFEPGHTDLGHYGAEIMRQNAHWLLANSRYLVLIEGHSDYKGTHAGNLAAAERRARAAMDFLVKAGVPAARIQIVSRGSDRPVCPEKTDACAAKNRRVHFLVKPQ